jgi:hypothetical protein
MGGLDGRKESLCNKRLKGDGKVDTGMQRSEAP